MLSIILEYEIVNSIVTSLQCTSGNNRYDNPFKG